MMHEEVKALSQIVTEFRAANDSEVSEIERQRASLKRGEGKGKKGAALPEAPAKQLLKQQILFFVDNLNSLRGGMDKNSSDLLASVPSTPREARVLAVVVGIDAKRAGRPGSSPGLSRAGRPSSATGSPRSSLAQRKRSSHRSLRPGSSMSTRSAPAGPLDKVGKFLNIFEIEKVVQDLKESLETEYRDLLEDIEYLNAALEEEHDYKVAATNSAAKEDDNEIKIGNDEVPPTLQELRNVSAKLEHSWLQAEMHDTKPDTKKTMKTGNLSAPKLKPLFQDQNRNLESFGESSESSATNEEEPILPKKTSRLRRRFQEAKVEDSDAKFFV